MYCSTIKIAIDFEKEKLFYEELEKFIGTVDLSKIPVFGIFLLFCIRPFNRNAILKLIACCTLTNIKYNGKYFILSQYYKQLAKSPFFVKKKKFLFRKDVCYPSTEMMRLK